jgi:hypothetical protein
VKGKKSMSKNQILRVDDGRREKEREGGGEGGGF